MMDKWTLTLTELVAFEFEFERSAAALLYGGK